ncbi:MAG TPA: S-methyl-5-thioribose-1-phosphate isomerase, partial [Sphaerochaeta sp.]|nr:S-methyl-5-thioribose-1-phosphate isomerase [Sphaerochaeta sp.]
MDESFTTLEFKENALHLIDQRVLPATYTHFICKTYEDVEFAIRDMVVRGAPAIGSTAAYGVYMAAVAFSKHKDFKTELKKACDFLAKSRPTAVNLEWAINRMWDVFLKVEKEPTEKILITLKAEADEI